jgi:hypothetical protein
MEKNGRRIRLMLSDKHAYLIIAHNNFEILKKLVVLLDDPRNDIYIHISSRVKNFAFEELRATVKSSNLIFTRRINVKWGGYSLIECELILLKAAIAKEYEYYHLLSGVDLPLKTQDYIHNFFDQNKGMIFLNMNNRNDDPDIVRRIKYYHILSGRPKTIILKMVLKPINKIILGLEQLMKIDRLKKQPMEIYMGANWFSITHSLAEYILSKEETIKKLFRYTFCADEIFIQMLVGASDYKNAIYHNDECNSNMRYIDWNRGKPYVWKTEDFEDLINSHYLFARKFDYEQDHRIVDRIYEYFTGGQV